MLQLRALKMVGKEGPDFLFEKEEVYIFLPSFKQKKERNPWYYSTLLLCVRNVKNQPSV